MRKLFFLLAFLCCVVTQLKADVIQPSTTPYYPEHVYTMMNANGWYANATTHGTQTASEAGHFAFYPVSEVENAYYIYSVDENQWLTYNKADSYSNTRDFISMSDSFGVDDYFYLNERQNDGYYDIAPYNNTGIASKYLNWYQGGDESHTTIGLWQQNLIDDPGSKFSFTEVTIDSEKIPYFTITSEGRGTWTVSKSMTSWYFQTSANLDASDELQHFAFIKKNGNVYLYNKGISKYINKDHSFSDEPIDGITFLYGAAIDKDKESNLNTDNNFVICFDDSHFINLGGDRQIIIDGWGPNSASNGDGKTDIGNCLTITKQGTFTIKQPEPEPEPEPEPDPEIETDRSEELAPLFGKVDIEGIKVTPTTGTFSSESFGDYGIWASDSTYSRWIGKNEDVDVYEHLPMVTIKTFTGTGKNEGHRFDLDGQTDHTLAFVISSTDLASMTIEAASGYNIVGYCFDYTAPSDITDNDSYEGEITCTAGTHHVEVKNLNAKDVDIAFGHMRGNITISNFYVFVRRGEQLTYTDLQRFSNLYYIPYAFTLAPYNKPDHHVYAPKDGKWLEACGNDCKKYKEVKVTGRDEAQQFVLIPFDSYYLNYPDYNGLYFLYSVSEKKFVSAQDGKAILTEYPIQAAAIEAGEGDYEGYFRINFNKTNLLNVSTGNCQADNADASCIITSHNEYDGGNHFLIRVARDFSFEPGDKMSQIFIESCNIEDQNLIDEKVAEIQALLKVNGPGSPTDDLRNILTQYLFNVRDYKESVAFFGLHRFLPEYKSTTSVKMPETGKAYRIKTHYMGNKGRYLKAAEDGKLTIVNAGQHEADNTTVFVVKSMDTAKDGEGTYAIVGENGQFLVGARTGTQGFVSSYNGGTNTGSLQLTTAANKGDYFGGFLLKTTEGTNTYNLQLGTTTNNTEMVITYDAENPGSIINDPNGGSSIFFLEEVNDYPNVVKLREPKEADGKAYSSIWLPFSVEIPEGVRAYKAHVDYTTNQLVCGEVKDILPGGEGAILISDKAQEIVLAPATADVAPLEKNDLQGTNVTKPRSTEIGVTTFVLNGGIGEIGFYPYTGTNIAKYKAYVEVNKAQAAQGLRFSFGTATDIENTLTEGEAKEYYDLSGRRVAQPTKGLYIVNGKKMYIK